MNKTCKNWSFLIAALLLLIPLKAYSADFYVAVNGSASGDGSITKPWDLPTALSHPASVKPGDTINIRAGTYYGRFNSKLVGSAQAQITVRNYQKERVILNAAYKVPILDAMPSTTGGYTNGEIRISDTSLLNGISTIVIDSETMNIVSRQAGGIIRVTRGWSGSCGSGPCPSHAAGSLAYALGAVLEANGSYTTFMGFEITDSESVRSVSTTGSSLIGSTLGTGVSAYGPFTKFINLIIHNNASGFGAWSQAEGSEYYGNLVFNNGWLAPDRGHGHGIYTQNRYAQKKYSRNIVLHNFGNVLQQYGSDQSFLDNFHWKENVFYNGRTIFGGGAPSRNVTLEGNFNYNATMQIGYSNSNNEGYRVLKNYLMGGITYSLTKNVESYDNTIYGGPSIYFNGTGNVLTDYKFDRNTYIQKNLFHPFNFAYARENPINTGSTYTWFNKNSPGIGYGGQNTTWQEDMGYDPNGTYIPGPRTGVKTFHLINEYDSDLSTLIVYNWDKSNSIKFNPGNFLKAGDTYTLHNTLDYFNDKISGTYSGGEIDVSMINHTVALPRGHNVALGGNTFPEFGVFMIRRVAGVAPSAPSSLKIK